MHLRAMILDTFAYNKSVEMHPKSTLREALEPTWTALGHPGANTPQTRPVSYTHLTLPTIYSV